MKKWNQLLVTILVVCFFSMPQTNAQNLECGTKLTPEDLEQALADQVFIQNFDRSTFSQVLTEVPLEIHIIRQSDGTGGLDLTVLSDAFEVVNNYYANANLVFNICDNINYIDQDTLYDFSTTNASTLANMYNVDNRINVYFFNSLVNSSGGLLAGNSTYPWSSTQRILMNNSQVSNGSTLSHEFGHHFGLLHTHDDANGAELVDGSNCSSAGDFVCDTPADPQLSFSLVNSSCVYTGTAVDANGDLYNPDPNNIMSYSRTSCRNHFSADQYDRIAYYYSDAYQNFACNTDFANLTRISGTANLNISNTTVTINTTIVNNGIGDANSSTIGFYASSNTSFSTLDYLIGTYTVPSLAIDENHPVTFSQDITMVTPNIPAGDYYIGYLIDYQNEVIELNENDNRFGWVSNGPSITVPEAICDAPTSLQETGLTCTDVTLSWDAMPDAQAYQLRGRKVGRPIKIFPQTQNTFRTFTDALQTNKTYEWGVRTKCDGVWTEFTPFNAFSTPTCKNSNYDETKDPFFVDEKESFFSEISLYPNPAKNDLNISFMSFSAENVSLKVVDIVGKTVLAEKMEVLQGENNITLNVKDLPSGTYFLEIENGFENTVQKFMVW